MNNPLSKSIIIGLALIVGAQPTPAKSFYEFQSKDFLKAGAAVTAVTVVGGTIAFAKVSRALAPRLGTTATRTGFGLGMGVGSYVGINQCLKKNKKN